MNLLKISPVLFSLALGACVISDGDDTDASETGTASATATMTATDPTDTDPATTDDPTSATQPTTDAESTGADSTGADSTGADSTGADSTGADSTDTGGVGLCGWIEAEGIYGCGGVGEDPSKTFPIECAEVPVEGAACDAKAGPITSVGCCADADTEAYCADLDGSISVAVVACE